MTLGHPEAQTGGEISGEQEKQHLATLVMINSALGMREDLKSIPESLLPCHMNEIMKCQEAVAELDKGLSYWLEKLQNEGFFSSNKFVVGFDSSRDGVDPKKRITHIGEYLQAEVRCVIDLNDDHQIEVDFLEITLPGGLRKVVFFDDLRGIELSEE